MKKMFLLFSHKLSDEQQQNALELFDVEQFISLPQELQKIWSNIDPCLKNLKETLTPIKKFLEKKSSHGDIVLIQGDFGACYQLVNYSKGLGLLPVYATTKRVVSEIEENGKLVKKSIFQHIKFREYIHKEDK